MHFYYYLYSWEREERTESFYYAPRIQDVLFWGRCSHTMTLGCVPCPSPWS